MGRSLVFGLWSLVVVGSGFWAVTAASAPAAQVKGSGLQALLDAELARFPAKAGIYVKHLTTGEEGAVRGDERFNSASVIKIPIMLLAYQMAEQDRLDLDERVPVLKSDLRGGSGVLRYHDLGLLPTMRDLITQMIITSDNTATDMVLARVGGVEAVNEWLKVNRLTDQRLNATLFEVFRNRYQIAGDVAAKLGPEDVYSLQSNDPEFGSLSKERFDRIQASMRSDEVQKESVRRLSEAPDTWLGVITPRGVGRMLEIIERCTIHQKISCIEMTAALRRQQSGARRLPHFLDVPVGHKTGDFAPAIANDVGIVYAPSGPIVISFLLNAIKEPYPEAEDRMGRTAQKVVEYFER